VFNKQEKIVIRGGLNLYSSFPVNFCNIIEKISSDKTPDLFDFPQPKNKVEHVIINLCPTEPWALPDWITLKHNTTKFLNKIKELKTNLFPDAKYHIIINENNTEHISATKSFADQNDWVDVYAAEAKYPIDDSVILSNFILGTDLDYGQEIISRGIVFLDAQTVSALFESNIRGNKVDSRFIAISGTGLKENEIINVQLGTSIEKILKERAKDIEQCRVFLNGPLRGREVNELTQSINWSINNIVVLRTQDTKVPFPMFRTDKLVFTTNIMGEPRRCIYCNYCDDIWPANLEPALYYHCYNRSEKQKTHLYRLEKCIECGLCSFACPSKIELLRIIKECKKAG